MMQTQFQATTAHGTVTVATFGNELVICDLQNDGSPEDLAKMLLEARRFCRDRYPGKEATITVDVNNDRMLKAMNEAGFTVKHYLMKGVP